MVLTLLEGENGHAQIKHYLASARSRVQNIDFYQQSFGGQPEELIEAARALYDKKLDNNSK